MAKNTENQENLKKYHARLLELDKHLVPSADLPLNQLIPELLKEGSLLLEKETKKTVPKSDEAQRLNSTLGSTSKNAYVRARIQVLQNYPEWRKREIQEMEKTGNVNNKFYEEFVHEVAMLGDKIDSQGK